MKRSISRTTKGWLLAALFLLSSATSLQVAAETHTIEIKRMKFRTPELTINVGDTVTWVNKEYRQYHSVWFEQLGEPEPEYFFPKESFSRTFGEAGDFSYRCGPHPKMTGVIKVIEHGK
ncbi:MAG: plastocyanin/azurin family copper-binding protein [Motiliproteus sp.]|nr:plastocyanin/azurin family copper-binding protein [Motiliproteus sp.]MCW9052232.1 plastocyanin/azurin family copper-binding protein [Motiliproteus sp.]